MIIGSAERGEGAGEGVRGEGRGEEAVGSVSRFGGWRAGVIDEPGALYFCNFIKKEESARERRNKCASHPPSSVISIIELTRMVYGTKFSMGTAARLH